MIKSFITHLLAFSLLFLVTYNLHLYFLDRATVNLRFEIKDVYIFFVITSFIICQGFFVLSSVKKTKEQLGFLYLGTLFLKIVLFVLTFYKSIIKISSLSKIESLNILIPLFAFLILEVYFIVRLLQQNTN